MWALIVDNKVAEVTDVDPNGRYHPSLQWVECGESVEVGDLLGEDANFTRPSSTQTQSLTEIFDRYKAELNCHMDMVARAHRYSDRYAFALRAGYPGPFHDEGVAFATWMDECYAKAFALMLEVEAGTKPLPALDDFLASFPEFIL